MLSDFQGQPGATLYSATGQLAATVINQPDWRGIGSLAWTLAAGDYWLVFEDSRAPGSGSMPYGAPMPLAGYASSPSVVPGQPWMLANTLNFGVRINTTPEPPPPIPEPATAWLWALGAGALLLRRVVGRGAQVTSMRRLGPRS